MRIALCLLPLALLATPLPAQDATQPLGDARMRTVAFREQERQAFAHYHKQEWDTAVAASRSRVGSFCTSWPSTIPQCP